VREERGASQIAVIEYYHGMADEAILIEGFMLT
jgi:hypothetical protein